MLCPAPWHMRDREQRPFRVLREQLDLLCQAMGAGDEGQPGAGCIPLQSVQKGFQLSNSHSCTSALWRKAMGYFTK